MSGNKSYIEVLLQLPNEVHRLEGTETAIIVRYWIEYIQSMWGRIKKLEQ